jgi:hypothetical protein
MSETTWENVCILCAARRPAKQTGLEHGHCCHSCADWLKVSLADIGHYAAEAACFITRTESGTGSGPATFGSRPPINVEAIDPELALVELNQGDPSSAVPILEALEMWERAIREDRGYGPYGPASADRMPKSPTSATETAVTLTGVLSFLAAQLDWIVTEKTFGLEEFADHVRRSAAVLRRWSTEDVQLGTRIACPTVTDEGDSCGAPIRVSTDGDPVLCRRCGRTWSIEWLIQVAGKDADGWADMEAVVRLSGLHERTIRKWATAGKVRKRGLLYSIRDVSESTSRMVSA